MRYLSSSQDRSESVPWELVFLEILQNSQENTCTRISFNKVAGWGLQLYEKRGSSTDVFPWILRNFCEHLFYRTPLGNCFWQEQADTKVVLYAKLLLEQISDIKTNWSPCADIDFFTLAILLIWRFKKQVILDDGLRENRKKNRVSDIDIKSGTVDVLIGLHAFYGNNYDNDHNILRLFDTLGNFLYTTSDMKPEH